MLDNIHLEIKYFSEKREVLQGSEKQQIFTNDADFWAGGGVSLSGKVGFFIRRFFAISPSRRSSCGKTTFFCFTGYWTRMGSKTGVCFIKEGGGGNHFKTKDFWWARRMKRRGGGA